MFRQCLAGPIIGGRPWMTELQRSLTCNRCMNFQTQRQTVPFGEHSVRINDMHTGYVDPNIVFARYQS